MSTKNDSKILGLKAQILEKKKQLKDTKTFSPVTNCSIELDGARYNIQATPKEQLIFILVKLNSYIKSYEDLAINDCFVVSGYLVSDWISDIKSKLSILSRKDEEKKLKDMESTLDKLLSDEKKTELELDNIASMLK